MRWARLSERTHLSAAGLSIETRTLPAPLVPLGAVVSSVLVDGRLVG